MPYIKDMDNANDLTAGWLRVREHRATGCAMAYLVEEFNGQRWSVVARRPTEVEAMQVLNARAGEGLL